MQLPTEHSHRLARGTGPKRAIFFEFCGRPDTGGGAIGV